jgi:predicted nucleic acid-binding Zn finger protein
MYGNYELMMQQLIQEEANDATEQKNICSCSSPLFFVYERGWNLLGVRVEKTHRRS